jgi:hypothetical protein
MIMPGRRSAPAYTREAALVDQLVKGTVGHDDEYLPEYRDDGGRR